MESILCKRSFKINYYSQFIERDHVGEHVEEARAPALCSLHRIWTKPLDGVLSFVCRSFVRIEFMEVNGHRQKSDRRSPRDSTCASLTVKRRVARTFCEQSGRAGKLLILRSD